MSYIGNTLQVAYPSYTNIDDISGSFNGVTTSFALTVGGVAPVPAPLSSNQCMISVGGVVQRPDDTGSEGFRLSGGNIIFSSAPNTGEDFFGVILAGADYVNVGGNFPSGTASTPSITFDTDLDTGIYNPAANQLGITCAGSLVSTFTSAGQSILSGSAAAPSLFVTGDANTGIYSPGADSIAISTGGAQRATVDASGRFLVGTSSSVDSDSIIQIKGRPSGTGSVIPSFIGGNTSDLVAGNALCYLNFYDGFRNGRGAYIGVEADASWGANDFPTRLVFSTTADGASSPTERMRIRQDGLTFIYAAYSNTSGGAANVVVQSDGSLVRSTSSIKYKVDVETLQNFYADNLLNCRPVWYRSTSSHDNPAWGYWGFIAEEVAAIDPRLVSWRTTESVVQEDGSRLDVPLDTPEAEGVQYDRFVPHLLNLIKRQKEQIEAMEARLSALEAQ